MYSDIPSENEKFLIVLTKSSNNWGKKKKKQANKNQENSNILFSQCLQNLFPFLQRYFSQH